MTTIQSKTIIQGQISTIHFCNVSVMEQPIILSETVHLRKGTHQHQSDDLTISDLINAIITITHQAVISEITTEDMITEIIHSGPDNQHEIFNHHRTKTYHGIIHLGTMQDSTDKGQTTDHQ